MTITLNSNVELHKMTVHIELEILMPRTTVIIFLKISGANHSWRICGQRFYLLYKTRATDNLN